jgi:DNA repair exonuclease SbcCD ATPase subunit
MILRSIRARGFMRYERMELGPLPAHGIVAVLGANESGKSTIGEAVSFALFGETVKSGLTDISQVVSWDADEAHVALELAARDGETLTFERTVDKRGGHRARLMTSDGEVLAEGPDAVAASVRERLGLDFEEFRASVYLAQDDLRSLREGAVSGGATTGDLGGDGSARAIEEIIGVGSLRRAADAVKRAIPKLATRRDELTRDLAVAEALLETHAVQPDDEERVRDEVARLEAVAREAEAAIPTERERLDALGGAIRARGAVGEAFARLERAMLARRARLACSETGGQLVAKRAGVERELARLDRELERARRRAGESRDHIDRLIEYQTRMAELEARLNLYTVEVRRRLSAPDVSEDDLVALEGLAMPATPAAAVRLAEVRANRLRAARNRAGWRALVFALLATAFLLFGIPALVKVLPPEEATPPTGMDQLVETVVTGLADTGFSETGRIWVAFAVGGCVGGVLFAVLSMLALRQVRSRRESLALAEEGRARLAEELEELEAEQQVLAQLDLKRPLEFADAVKKLQNEEMREAFNAIRDGFNDFIGEAVPRSELMGRERAVEAHRQREAQELGERRVRLERLLTQMPSVDGRFLSAGQPDPAPIPDDTTPFEERAAELASTFARALARLADFERLDEDAEPRERLEQLWADVDAVCRALGETEAAGLVRFRDKSRIGELAHQTDRVGFAELEAWLEREAEALERLLPPAEKLLAARDDAERRLREVTASRDGAAARLGVLCSRAAELDRRQAQHREALARATALRGELKPLAHDIAVRELAWELLEETVTDVRRRMGPMLARFVAAVLPRVTGGRYRRVRVLPNLDLRVYSPDKNDFVPLVDLSAGAADQLLLVLRLAVSAALGRAKGLSDPRQFLFLDEPLASFDERRAASFLDILEELDAVFPQVMLVAHGPLAQLDGRFALVIPTDVDQRVLELEVGADGGGAASGAGVGTGTGTDAGAGTRTDGEAGDGDAPRTASSERLKRVFGARPDKSRDGGVGA